MQTDELVASPTQQPSPRRTIEIGGHPIVYVDDGEGPVLLFVHAGAGSFRCQHVIVRLRDAPDLVARAIRGWWREEVLAA